MKRARNFGHEDAGRATPETIAGVVRNHAIDEFLSTNDKLYVVGPKGSGKTLLLKKKAIAERRASNALCIPTHSRLLVDQLTAASHVGQAFHRKFSEAKSTERPGNDSNLAWTGVWKYSILISVLHHVRDAVLSAPAKPKTTRKRSPSQDELTYSKLVAAREQLDKLLRDSPPTPQLPYAYYTSICSQLDSAGRAALASIHAAINSIDELLWSYQGDVNVFLDNIDDYYEHDPALWLQSMFGQFRAVREINLRHSNIHVFTTLRQDVYSQFDNEMLLQYFDYISQLHYTKSELCAIFEGAVERLEDDLLAEPTVRNTEPLRSLFGDCTVLRNEFVGCDERIWDYIHRHTLGRPREIIHMGTVLLQHRKNGSFQPAQVRRAVHDATTLFTRQYLKEIAPLIDPRLEIAKLVSRFVSTAIMTRADLDAATAKFVESHEEDILCPGTPSDLTRPFDTLYDVGLLGLSQKVVGEKHFVQHFQPAGHGPSDPINRHLPKSDLYFLHPILNHFISPAARSNRMVIGDEHPVVAS